MGWVTRFAAVAALAALLVGCGGDDESTDAPRADESDGTFGGDDAENGEPTVVSVGPGELHAEQVELEAGELARVSINALGQVDLYTVASAGPDAVAAIAAATGTTLDAGDAGEGAAAWTRFEGAPPTDTVPFLGTSADAWDEQLGDDAIDDASNLDDGDEVAFYETRVAFAAPAAGTYWVYAYADETVDVEVRVETEMIDAPPATDERLTSLYAVGALDAYATAAAGYVPEAEG